MVGAVVVDADGVVVGQGYHARAGEPHAESVALDEAGGRARGATLYVTLEPCCHVGRTGPCTTRIIAAGISAGGGGDARSVSAGRRAGVRLLREAGIAVDVGLEEAAARRLNARLPDGAASGSARWSWSRSPRAVMAGSPSGRDRPTRISGEAAAAARQRLRAAVDAIAVGAGTVLADDPRLTARDVVRARPLTRVVFDRALETPPRARASSRRLTPGR